ncbi:MAG TPA: YdcF family protein [Gaiellaceae bacterium]|nr:YdcF family protein [Gaiellaceae bacterium]
MLRRLLAALGMLLGLWLVAVAVLFVWPPANDAPPAHADVVVVLAGGLNHRLDPALKLVQRGVAPVLAISGGLTDPRWKKAARLCRRQDGPTRFRVICFQASPFSTRGEAETVSRLARAHGWHRIVVVTSMYHVTRARMLFRRCFRGQLWTVGTGARWSSLPDEWLMETGKLVVQAVLERGC